MSVSAAMNRNMTAAAFAAAGSRARCASMSDSLIPDAIIVASLFVVRVLSVRLQVLAVVLVRIITGLVAPSNRIHHKAMSQT